MGEGGGAGWYTDQITCTFYKLYDNKYLTLLNQLKMCLFWSKKWNGFIQIITCLKWLFPVTLVFTKQLASKLDQNFLTL